MRMHWSNKHAGSNVGSVKSVAIVAVLAILLSTVVMAFGAGTPTAYAQPDVGGPPDINACYGVADEAFGTSGSAPDGLSLINRSTGATTNIGGQTGTTDVEAIAFAPGTIIDPLLTQQVLYTFDGTDFGFLNLTTGIFSSLNLAPPAGFTTVDGMTWDSDLEVFWVTDRVSGDGQADQVAAYDPTTGATTLGPFATGIATDPTFVDPAGLPYDDFDDIAIDPQEDFRLYALLNKGGTGGGLVELDKTDGTIIDYKGLFTPDAASDFDGDGVTDDLEGLAFFDDRQLYGSTGANGPGEDINRLYLIDLDSDQPTTTYIGDFVGYGDYEALGCLTVGASIDVLKGTAEPGGAPTDGPTITTRSVEWTYVITNTSALLDLGQITLVDDLEGELFNQTTGQTRCAEGVLIGAGELLAPDASLTCTVTGSTITGDYSNLATTTGVASPGSGLRDIDVSDTDPSNYIGDPVAPPAIDVVKTVAEGPNADCGSVPPVPGDGPLLTVASGQTVTFCVTVTNTGGSPATAVTVTDDSATPTDPADDQVVPGLENIDLDAGASATGSYDVVVTSLDVLLNTVTATATDPFDGTPTNSPTDTAQVQALSSPELEIVKTVVAGTTTCDIASQPGLDSVTVDLGDTVSFCITVRNIGATPATNVTVTDDNLTPADATDDFEVPGLVGLTLAAGDGASAKIEITPPAPGINTVTATGTDPNTGLPTNSPTDPAEVKLLGTPVLSVVKTIVAGTSDCVGVTPAPGLDAITIGVTETVTYCVTVTNSGDTAATNVTVTDDSLTPADTTDDVDVPGLIDITLEPGASATGALVTTASAAGVNTVTANGTDPNTGLPTNSPTDPAQVNLLGGPVLEVVKTIVAGTSDCAGVTPIAGPDDITVETGDTVTYCVTVTNTGATFAAGVTVTDDNLTPADTADDVDVPGLVDIRLEAGASASGAIVTTATAAGVNTVTATGIDPISGQPTNSPTDPAEVKLLGPPVLEVVKTIVAGTSDCVGVAPAPGLDDITVEVTSTITYCVTVTNTGATAAANVTVVDDSLTPTDPVDDVDIPGLIDITLEPGASATGALVTTASKAGVNTVSVSGIDPNTGLPTNMPTDPAELKLLDPPVLEVVKTIVAGTSDCANVTPIAGPDDITVELGETVTYCVTVTNTGATFATGVTVTDDNLTPADTTDDVPVPGLVDLRLEAGASATGAIVTTASRSGVNTVTATGTDPISGDPTNSPTDPAEVKLLGAPVLEVVKTIVAGTSDCVGVAPAPGLDDITVETNDTVTYCVTVTNTGATFATGVTVTDDSLTPTDTADDVNIPGLVDIRLEAGASATGALVTTAAQAGVNTVTASGIDPITGAPTNSPTDPAEVKLLGTPVLEVVKTAVAGDSDCVGVTPAPGLDSIVVEIGDTVTYCVTVTNTGDTAAANVTVVDDSFTPADPTDDVDVPGLVDISLAPGASETGALVTTATAVGTNTVTATGTDPNTGNPTNSATDPAEITLLGPPVLEVVKTAVAGTSDCVGVNPAAGLDDITVEINSTVTYCVTVTNTGETFATGVTVTDDNLTPALASDDVSVPGLIDLRLEAGASATGALVTTATQAGVNTVTAVGTNPLTNGPTNSPTDPAEVKLLGPPILEVVKTAVAGDNVDCAAVDPQPGFDEVPTVIGATVTFCVTVTNTGDTAAEQVTVTDDNFTPADTSDDTVIAGLDGITLASGASATGSFTFVVVSQDAQTNTITATGVDPNTSLPTNEPTDTAGIRPPAGNAELAVVKTAVVGDPVDCATVDPEPGEDAEAVKIGDSVTFCITVTNVGNGPASDVVVIDDNFTPADTSDDAPVAGLDGIDLEPQASATGSVVFVVTELGTKVNIVTASGTDVNGDRPTNEPQDPSRLQPFGTPILTIAKTAVAGAAADVDCATVAPAMGLDELVVSVGDSVTYCIVVTNTGDGPATDVQIVDDNFTPNDTTDDVVVAEAAQLAPGATLVGSFTEQVTSAAALENTATASGTDPETGQPTNEPTDPSSVVAPAIDLTKQVLRGTDQAPSDATEGVNELIIGRAGDDITWVYTVTNTGSVPLIVEEISDPSINITVPIPADDQLIAPGESITVTANGVVSENGATSDAEVVGQPADDTGQPITGLDALQATNNAAEGPANISLTKQILRGKDRDCADAVEGVNEVVVAEPGDDITWCFTITNTGVSSLTNVTFTDQNLGIIDLDVLAISGAASLAPGESIQLPGENDVVPAMGIVSAASVAADPSNAAGQTDGTAFVGAPTLDDTNDARNDSLEITLEKRVLLGFDADCSTAVEGVNEGVKGRLGDDVTWCFTAINTGSVALRITEIVDVTLDAVLQVPEALQILETDDTVTLQLNGVIDRETVLNTASVEGAPVDPVTGIPVIDAETNAPVDSVLDTNTATKAPFNADLSLIKTNELPDGVALRGAVVEYTIEITNKGPDTARDVEVVDVLPAGLEYVDAPNVLNWSCQINTENTELLCEKDRIPKDVVETLTYTVRILDTAQLDVALVNTAEVDFNGVDPTPEDNKDTADVRIPRPPVCVPYVDAACTPVIPVCEPPNPDCTPPPPPPEDEVLAEIIVHTGAHSDVMAGFAMLSILAGSALMVLGRRRRDDVMDLHG